MKTVLIIAGTRPEIIKTAPLVLEAQKRKDIRVIYCLTGQHTTMAQEALEIFQIKPQFNLQIMRPNQTLNMIAEAVFAKLPQVLDDVNPDIVLVQGDTTTAAMAALACFNQQIPVGHIEAGLRSFNLFAPYPEELNRKVISCLARFNFVPTENAKRNLLEEKVPETTIFVTGNTVVDALRIIVEQHSLENVREIVPAVNTNYVLVTAHRRESFGDGFNNICEALKWCAREYPEYDFVYPVHLNPHVAGPVHTLLDGIKNIHLISPQPYLQLLTLLKNCSFVLTDSGGIQEEAPSFGKYTIVMRDVTERMESVEMGYSELVGASKEKIIKAVQRQIERPTHVDATCNPYGDGFASRRILDILTTEKE
ncbi:MAG: UDP-N-acetylglucosamine 2-epimerase (non-hydrolyzing) [Bacteroidetes bacterium]|nr:UDP-N-acetylglucosamine 2-epimerase (non-hydrolyzing) [Bacteroidota bacterium]